MFNSTTSASIVLIGGHSMTFSFCPRTKKSRYFYIKIRNRMRLRLLIKLLWGSEENAAFFSGDFLPNYAIRIVWKVIFITFVGIQGLLQKFPDKPKIDNTSGDICEIFWAFNRTSTMDIVSKFHDIRMYESWVIVSDVTVRLNHRSKNEFWATSQYHVLFRTR